MQAFKRALNARDSFYQALLSAINQARAVWVLPRNNRGMGRTAFSCGLLEDEQVTAFPTVHFSILEDDVFDEYEHKDLALIQVDIFVQRDKILARFLRAYLSQALNLTTDNNSKEGYISFKDYVADPNNPITAGSIKVRFQPGTGWRQLKPGQPGRTLADPSVIHHVATLILSY